MKISKLIQELEKEDPDEELLVQRGDFQYDFDLGIDNIGKPVISLLKRPEQKEIKSF